MARSFPPDVVVLDSRLLIHARVGRGRKEMQILQAKSYALRDDVFAPGVVTPELRERSARWPRRSAPHEARNGTMGQGLAAPPRLLVPDEHHRAAVAAGARQRGRRSDPLEPAAHACRSIRRQLRLSYEVLTPHAAAQSWPSARSRRRSAAIERLFEAAGIEVILIEPAGLNIWNAITAREAATTRDRIFFYIREHDFTTAVFRGAQPLFIRSRNLDGERTLQQEIRLSATYLRDTLQTDVGREVLRRRQRHQRRSHGRRSAASSRRRCVKIALRDVAEQTPGDAAAYDAELTASTGVFTG